MSDTAGYIGGDLLYKMNNHCQDHVIFLNFAKAFNWDPHQHLLSQLSNNGITYKSS